VLAAGRMMIRQPLELVSTRLVTLIERAVAYSMIILIRLPLKHYERAGRQFGGSHRSRVTGAAPDSL